MLNIAIVGIGNISKEHIEGYLEFQDRCRIVALVDIYPEKAAVAAGKNNLNAVILDSHKKLMERDDIDLVSVCTPPYTHREISVDMLESGKHVLLEKPMAPSLEECDAIINAVARTGKRLSVISQNRFKSSIMNLKKMLDSGVAGKLLHAQVDSFWWRAHCYYDLWWRGTWEKEGGGCTLNHAVHHIDMLCWIQGLPVEINSVIENLGHDNSEVEDFSVTVSKYQNQSVSTLTSSLIHHGEDQKLVFQCEKAKISAPWSVYVSKGRSNGFYDKDEEKTAELDNMYKNMPALKFEEHKGQIDNVLTGLIEDVDFLVNPEDGRNSIEYITAVYKSGFGRKRVSLPLKKDDDFYTVDGIMGNISKFYEKSCSVENFADSEITVGRDLNK